MSKPTSKQDEKQKERLLTIKISGCSEDKFSTPSKNEKAFDLAILNSNAVSTQANTGIKQNQKF